MEDAVSIQMWQFILGVLGLGGTCIGSTWGVVKYLIARQDAKHAEVFARIDKVERAFVPREEYVRDSQRLYDELQNVREALERQATQHANRLDNLLMAIGKMSSA